MAKHLRIGWKRLQQELSLTDKEIEVLKELSTGDSEPAIAETLGVSKHTIHSYTKRFYIVLDVHTRGELVCALHDLDAELGGNK